MMLAPKPGWNADKIVKGLLYCLRLRDVEQLPHAEMAAALDNMMAQLEQNPLTEADMLRSWLSRQDVRRYWYESLEQLLCSGLTDWVINYYRPWERSYELKFDQELAALRLSSRFTPAEQAVLDDLAAAYLMAAEPRAELAPSPLPPTSPPTLKVVSSPA